MLYHFICIWLYEEFVICEPNVIILILETAGIGFILYFCISYTVNLLRSMAGNKLAPNNSPAKDSGVKSDGIRSKKY